MSNKELPSSTESEIAVLGAMMLRKEYIEKAIGLLSIEDFYLPRHQMVFKAISEMYTKDIPVDIITISDYLLKEGQLDLIGGRRYLAKINKEVGTGANIEKYGLIVLEQSLRRITIKGCGLVITHMENLQRDPLETLGLFKSVIDKIESKVNVEEVKSEIELVNQAIKEIREEADGTVKKLNFSIYDLNKNVSFRKKDMLIIGGRPSMGKTAFALTEAEYWASLGFKVLIVSIEMSAISLAIRRLSMHSGHEFSTLVKGGKELDDAETILKSKLKGNLFIDDRGDINVFNAKARIMQAVRKYGIEIVIWDYVQLMKGEGNNREEELTGLSGTIKRIGKDLDLYNVVLAQLNRDSTKATKVELLEPKLSELKGSGSLEQDADTVIFTHRLHFYKNDYLYPEIKNDKKVPSENVGELIIRKQRNGKVGKVFAKFDGSRMLWSDYQSINYDYNEEVF